MKTKAKSTAKNKRNKGKTHSSTPVRKRIEDRDLNKDEEDRITNVPVDEITNGDRHQTLPQDHEVEEEEDREKNRKVEEARGEEEN